MSRRVLAGLATLALFLAACGTDPAGPGNTADAPIGGPSLGAGDQTTEALIIAQLTCLYDKGVVPDKNSSLGKFDKIIRLVKRGDLAGALSATGSLIAFIDLKFEQYSGDKITTVDCGDPLGSDWTLQELKDGLFGQTGILIKPGVEANLWSYAGLEGNVCQLPANNDPSFCQTEETEGGFVYFPQNIFSNLSYVAVDLVPNPDRLQAVFDEYPNQVQITIIQADGTVGGDFSDDTRYPDKPIVVVCFNEDPLLTPSASIWGRLRLITKHDGVAKFVPLPQKYDQEVQDYASALCDPPAPSPSSFALFGRRLVDFLLPQPLIAQGEEEYDFGGVGGSPEEFSPFSIGDVGLDAFGGVGGSPEEFAPGMLPSGPMAVNGYDPTDPPGGTWFGQVGDAGVTTGLPGVTVTTQPRVGGTGAACVPTFDADGANTNNCYGIPVGGVVVRFTLKDPSNPVTSPVTYPASSADLCGATVVRPAGDDPYIEVSTGAAGTATAGRADLPCLDFGNTLGFKKLRATFDPSGVDPEACMFNSARTGACLSDPYRNFLIETVVGAPASLSVTPTPTSGAAGSAFSFDVQVKDANGNDIQPVPGETLPAWTVTASGANLGGTLTGTTDASGFVTMSGITVGGVIGEVTPTFTVSSSDLTGDSFIGTNTTATINLDAPDDASEIELTTAPVAGRLDEEFTVMPSVKVTDQWGNTVSGQAVAVALAAGEPGTLACVAPATGCDAGTTGSGGTYTFDNLTITNLYPISTQTLHFTAGSTTCVGTTDAFCAADVLPNPGAAVLTQFAPTPADPDFPDVPAFASRTAQVLLADAYGNPVDGQSLTWTIAKTTLGSTRSVVSGSAGGLYGATWTLGDDGTNSLTAAYGAQSVVFTATTVPGPLQPLSCALGNPTKKLDMGGYANGVYTAWYAFEDSDLPTVIRSMTLYMSVTGQSSGLSNYGAQVRVYSGSSTTSLLLAKADFGTSVDNGGVLGNIQLPGDNGNAAPVKFHLDPQAFRSVSKIFIELKVETGTGSRTPQVWYNSKANGTDYCASSIGYPAGTTDPALVPIRSQSKGIANTFTNQH